MQIRAYDKPEDIPVIERERRWWDGTISSVFRAYMASNAVLIAYLSIYAPTSTYYRLAYRVDASVLLYVLGLCGLVGLIDVALDFGPKVLRCRIVQKYRHLVFVALAFSYLAQMFVAFRVVQDSGMFFGYVFNVVALLIVALIDADQRARA